ncbi:hypothetical protein D9758_003100 [Tetrapyrgos nigripes]|uniref:NAD(P)-binding protein n=1 Tax=Tetrapyrgos nigripes TaxID=182062 RepID=A0A8H5GPL4_9AGAR|nr:hypothetical protein D9758_003100 [Tetrapyrgos nigripes]
MTTTTSNRQTVAIAGASDLAKYLVEELSKTEKYDVVVLSRAERPWFSSQLNVTLRITDYSLSSVLSILNDTNSIILFSFLHSNDPKFYNPAHSAMLQACQQSHSCKRFVPSEYGGNLQTHPLLPRFYEPTHAEFRKELAAQDMVQYTLVNIGWFMDYFAPVGKSWMKALHPVWPVDLEKWEGTVLGTGEEPIAWTSARDVAKALVRLVEVEKWEKETYLCGELGTWNSAIKQVEEFYGPILNKKEMKKTQLPASEIKDSLCRHANDEDPSLLWKTFMDEWNITGASAVPWDIVVAQREKYFEGIKFRSIRELMEDADSGSEMV